MRRSGLLLLCLVVAHCAPREEPQDGGFDSGTPDASVPDASVPDSGVPDSGVPDSGVPDSGVPDSGVPDAGPDLRCTARSTPLPDGGMVRIIAANLSSGNLQSWNPGHGKRILQGLKPDVVLIQEWNVGNETDVDRRAFVDSLGPDYCFTIQSPANIPNGVISRFPIVDAGEWVDNQLTDRSFSWAQIDVPGPVDLWAVSVHLHTGGKRPAQATALVNYVNQNVPAGAYLVIGGDFNSSSRTEPAMTTLSQVVRTAGPYPVDQSNNQDTNANRNSPYDWVAVDEDLHAHQVPVVIGASQFDAGLVFDSRVYQPLSDVSPVLVGDSAATGMQHMAVVKDFLLP